MSIYPGISMLSLRPCGHQYQLNKNIYLMSNTVSSKHYRVLLSMIHLILCTMECQKWDYLIQCQIYTFKCKNNIEHNWYWMSLWSPEKGCFSYLIILTYVTLVWESEHNRLPCWSKEVTVIFQKCPLSGNRCSLQCRKRGLAPMLV